MSFTNTDSTTHIACEPGSRFGLLVVVERAGRTKCGGLHWLLACDCGNTKIAAASDLRRGSPISCGCVRRGRVTTVKAARRKPSPKVRADAKWTDHGHSPSGGPSPTYYSWASMNTRCTNENHSSYANYGGRGIRVCERWTAFVNFLADMGARPAGTSLDRINVNGNYEPGNCRWATASEQRTNQRKPPKIEPREPAQMRWLISLGYPKPDIAAFFDISLSYLHDIHYNRIHVDQRAA